MTTATQPSVNAKNFFEKAESTFMDLKERWMCESEYEDIKDYKLPLTRIAKKHNVVINKMIKRPFGCIFTTDDRMFQVSVTDRVYQYKRIR